MKKIFSYALMFVAGAAAMMNLTACSSDDNSSSTTNGVDLQQKEILGNYVSRVIVPTYRSLADAAIVLANDCKDLSTQAKVDKACSDWKEARRQWELSEAFLFGAAADYSIDPHIDSWPLDLTQLNEVLTTGNIADRIEKGTAGYGLLGFHAVEYVIFKEGSTGDAANRNREASSISQAEADFAEAVAEDMMVQCVRLEAAWAGVDNISSEKKAILEDAELEPSLNYGNFITTAGLEGNAKYKTQADAFEEIIVGASDIANEVGNTKISDPMESGNWSDVESPHSWNSVSDFADNIRSVRNAYYGSLDGTVAASSVSNYVASKNKSVDAEIRTCIANAISAIEAMPKPFRNYIGDKSGDNYNRIQAAVKACNELVDALDKAQEAIKK